MFFHLLWIVVCNFRHNSSVEIETVISGVQKNVQRQFHLNFIPQGGKSRLINTS